MFDRTLTRRTALSHAVTALAGATGLGVLDDPDQADDAGGTRNGSTSDATAPATTGASDGYDAATDADPHGDSHPNAGDDCEGAIDPDIAVVGARRRGDRYVAKAGDVVTFDASETTSRAPVDSYRWAFGSDPGLSERVHYTWEQGGGVTTVTLTVLDEEGNVATANVEVAVEEPDRYNDAPTPFHDVSPARTYDDGYIVQAGDVLTFDARGSSDPDGKVVDYEWSFRYGAKKGAIVEHSFRRTGNYDVTLTVTDDDGASESVPIPVHVNR